jgi:hypothetical protein
MKFTAALPVTAGTVKLFTCSAAGDPQQYLADIQADSAASSSSISANLALQGHQLGSLSSSPRVLLFTVVVGDNANTGVTGATAQLEMLPGEWQGLSNSRFECAGDVLNTRKSKNACLGMRLSYAVNMCTAASR